MNKVADQNSIMIQIPTLLFLFIGRFGDFLRYFWVSVASSSVNHKLLSLNTFYSNNKSIKELNLIYTPIAKAIEDAIEFLTSSKTPKI